MTTTSRTRKLTKVGSGAAGLGLAVLAVLGFSNAAFSADVDNTRNNWAAQGATEVDLESDVDVPLFSFGLGGAPMPGDHTNNGQFAAHDSWITGDGVTGPNDDGVRDIELTYTGDPAADVRMYVSNKGAATGDLDERTLVTVERDGQTIVNEVALSDMPANYTQASANPWLVDEGAGTESAVYEITLKTDEEVPEVGTVQGVVFTWEAQHG